MIPVAQNEILPRGIQTQLCKKVIEGSRRTGFIGLVKAQNNLLKLYSFIHNQYSIEYLLSYKLSQNHLETFFSSVEQRENDLITIPFANNSKQLTRNY